MKVILVFSSKNSEKPIPGFDGYFATYEGEIISYKRGKREIKTINHGKKGYCTIGLTPDGEKYQNQRIHRMVALAWIPNPNNYPQVNHKDGNKKNNKVSNLEWADSKQQIRHAYDNNLIAMKYKPVLQADLEGNIIREYKSVTDAANATGGTPSGISACCKGKQITSKGFCWFYKDDKNKRIRGHGNAKAIQKFTLKGELVAEYKSIRLAAEANGVDSMSIVNYCKGRMKKQGKKYIWKYKEHVLSPEEILWNETKNWAELKEYPKYRISRDGRIYSEKTRIIMKNQWSGTGMTVSINKKDEKAKPVFVHRLVALAYIPNPKNLPVVNHLDSNQKNNNTENLEWATHIRNSQHATDAGLMKNRKPIIQMDLEGNFIKRFNSCREAARELKGNDRAINDAVRGRNNTSYGYTWKYE